MQMYFILYLFADFFSDAISFKISRYLMIYLLKDN